MIRQARSALNIAVLAAIGASHLPAQGAEADLLLRLQSPDGAPVVGALVALVDSREGVVREGVTDEAGLRSLRAPRGSYRVRVRRIGFLPFLSAPVAVGSSSEITLRVESPRVLLQTIVVTSRSKCGPIDPRDRILSAVWDEIAKALRASQLKAGDFSDYSTAFVYRKALNARGSVISSDTVFRSVGGGKPFGVRNPLALLSHGYVVGDERSGWTYYAPDETVLLSDSFAATHCFQVLRESNRAGQIGIEFAPVPGRSLPEIAGVLWVDESTAELRELIFRFVNAGPLERFRAGGHARFRRVRSGSWIVHDWALVAPVLEREPGARGALRVTGYVEDGGGLILRPRE